MARSAKTDDTLSPADRKRGGNPPRGTSDKARGKKTKGVGRRQKISDEDIDRAAEQCSNALKGTGKMASSWRKSGRLFQRRVASRRYKAYLADGGTPGNWQEFFKWLIENLPALIAAIMELFKPV